MADFLTTKEIAAGLQNIIQDAQQQLLLISPYIKVDRQIKERLVARADSGSELSISIIYGKEELRPQEWEWLKTLPAIEVKFSRYLHAKCYLNERVALVTSMNLYDFSEGNDEMGILVSAKDDQQLYNKVLADAMRIAKNSEVRKAATANPTPSAKTRPAPKPAPRKSEPSIGIPTSGFCIRDKVAIPADPSKPYCNRCYQIWNRFQNEDYEEEYCHICGNENDSTMEKPACLSCYRKYKDILEFAL